eukprot:51664_1
MSIVQELRCRLSNNLQRSEYLSNGYCRINSYWSVPYVVKEIVYEYFGYLGLLKPEHDPSNFITKEEIRKSDQLKKEANELFEQEEYKKAIEKYTEALSNRPNDGDLYIQRCMCYLRLHDGERAFSDAKSAVHCEPTYYISWQRLGESFHCLQRYTEAVECLDHASDICILNGNKKAEEITISYYNNLMDLKEDIEEENSDKININHMNDIDRRKWKDCKCIWNENKLNDEQLLTANTLYIQRYLFNIKPISERYNNTNEWMDRKWIEKCRLWKKLNTNKILFEFEEYVKDNYPLYFDIWAVSWRAQHIMHLGKRVFMVSIMSNMLNKLVYYDHVYTKPSGKYIAECIKRAIISPMDFEYHVLQQHKDGVKRENIMYRRRPMNIGIQYRMKDEFNEIEQEMEKLGILCRLLSENEMIKSCKNNNTDVGGWNYLRRYPVDTFEPSDIAYYI